MSKYPSSADMPKHPQLRRGRGRRGRETIWQTQSRTIPIGPTSYPSLPNIRLRTSSAPVLNTPSSPPTVQACHRTSMSHDPLLREEVGNTMQERRGEYYTAYIRYCQCSIMSCVLTTRQESWENGKLGNISNARYLPHGCHLGLRMHCLLLPGTTIRKNWYTLHFLRCGRAQF